MFSVLVIEDEPEILSVVKEFLDDEGFTAFYPESEQEVVDCLSRKPTVAVVDIQLTKWSVPCDGLRLMTLLRENAVETIIAMSAAMTSTDIEQAYAAGATEFMAKPVDYEELMTRLQSLASTEDAARQ